MDVEDRLELRVVSARDLPEVEGGDCNPFVLVKCGGEAEQTHVVNNSQNPEWTTQRMIFLDVAENDVDHVVLSVWHKNLGGGYSITPIFFWTRINLSRTKTFKAFLNIYVLDQNDFKYKSLFWSK